MFLGFCADMNTAYIGVNASRETQNICVIFVQRTSNVFDVGPTLYKYYTNVLCLLGCQWQKLIASRLSTDTLVYAPATTAAAAAAAATATTAVVAAASAAVKKYCSIGDSSNSISLLALHNHITLCKMYT